jgi:MFS family permease
MSAVPSEAPNSSARAGVLGFTAPEARVLLGTSAIYALRMLGVYLAFPVLSRYATDLPGSTAVLVGLSVGAYGLTQAIFQIPLGALGDRIGRGRALALGLLLFGAGSVICALSRTAPLLVLGRLVQGAGAMASTMIALLGDRARAEVRTRAMAAMGLFIGGAFATGLVFGAAFAERFGMPALFGFSAVASFVGVAALPWAVGGMKQMRAHGHGDATLSRGAVINVLTRPPLLAADMGIMLLHLGLTALFVVLPLRLHTLLPASQQGLLYAPVLALGFGAMWITSHIAETPRGTRIVLALGSLFLAAGLVSLAFGHSVRALAISLALYVVGFASLEPSLAASVTRHAEPAMGGTAAGVFNTVQFIGVFLGGLAAGAALGRGEMALFVGIAAAQLLWVAVASRALGTREPQSS